MWASSLRLQKNPNFLQKPQILDKKPKFLAIKTQILDKKTSDVKLCMYNLYILC